MTGFTLKLHWNDSEVAIHKSTIDCVCVCVNFPLHFMRFWVFAAVVVETEVFRMWCHAVCKMGSSIERELMLSHPRRLNLNFHALNYTLYLALILFGVPAVCKWRQGKIGMQDRSFNWHLLGITTGWRLSSCLEQFKKKKFYVYITVT